jgi:1-acyl-sn-glycerol-3-phosphate acyltransferase
MGALRRLDHCWRVAATGFSFAVFGFCSLFVGLTVLPLIGLAARSVERRRILVQRTIHWTMRGFVRMLRLLGIASFEVQGRERLRIPGSLIVANHPSLLDVVFLIALMPQVDCLVKDGLRRNPFLRWAVFWADYIPNGGDPETLLRDAAACLRAGRSLIVFPEGTRSVPGQPLVMRRGAARIALMASAPILPVTIVCRPPTLAKGVPWYRIPDRRPHWEIQVGEPIAPASFAGGLEAAAARRLTGRLLDHFGAAGVRH